MKPGSGKPGKKAKGNKKEEKGAKGDKAARNLCSLATRTGTYKGRYQNENKIEETGGGYRGTKNLQDMVE